MALELRKLQVLMTNIINNFAHLKLKMNESLSTNDIDKVIEIYAEVILSDIPETDLSETFDDVEAWLNNNGHYSHAEFTCNVIEHISKIIAD